MRNISGCTSTSQSAWSRQQRAQTPPHLQTLSGMEQTGELIRTVTGLPLAQGARTLDVCQALTVSGVAVYVGHYPQEPPALCVCGMRPMSLVAARVWSSTAALLLVLHRILHRISAV
ncbi:hypothetical protein Vretimale_14253 [Volvox reticuliferus]|uniref:Uncharacterized protein n=1 Tax=Volvox reticuliferus TaxID=1737510 RepID=A0A8J4LUL0_9CHLO|nr:hypothetical protein Vretimale_14253 [Volvox reticuliferus]